MPPPPKPSSPIMGVVDPFFNTWTMTPREARSLQFRLKKALSDVAPKQPFPGFQVKAAGKKNSKGSNGSNGSNGSKDEKKAAPKKNLKAPKDHKGPKPPKKNSK